MAIKKVYAEVIAFLESNSAKAVKTILDDVKAMCTAKRRSGGDNTIYDVKKKLVAIKDSYFGLWMPLVGDEAVEFGSKAGSPTGLSPMCKEAAKHWSKQLAKRNKDRLGMVTDIKNGKLKPEDIEKREAEIEAEFQKVAETELGFDTKEEIIEYLTDSGVKLA